MTTRAVGGSSETPRTDEIGGRYAKLSKSEQSGESFDLYSLARTLERALAQAGAERAWQPIETAPFGGEEVLLAGGGKVSSGHFWMNMNQRYPRNRWVWAGGPHIQPTHWMPLPAPPALQEQP